MRKSIVYKFFVNTFLNLAENRSFLANCENIH